MEKNIAVSVIQVGLVNVIIIFFFGKCERGVRKKINYILRLVDFYGDTLLTIQIAGRIA